MLQSLIEKHFPAPDRKKLYSLLGIDLTAPSNNSSPRDSPCKENKVKKRKGGFFSLNDVENSKNLSILKQLYFGIELACLLNWHVVAYSHCRLRSFKCTSDRLVLGTMLSTGLLLSRLTHKRSI